MLLSGGLKLIKLFFEAQVRLTVVRRSILSLVQRIAITFLNCFQHTFVHLLHLDLSLLKVLLLHLQQVDPLFENCAMLLVLLLFPSHFFLEIMDLKQFVC